MGALHLKFTYFWQDYFTDTYKKLRKKQNGNAVCQSITGHIKSPFKACANSAVLNYH
jgi:hypothetical protein